MSESAPPASLDRNVRLLAKFGISGFAPQFPSSEIMAAHLQDTYDHCWRTINSVCTEAELVNQATNPRDKINEIASGLWKSCEDESTKNHARVAFAFRWQRTERKENDSPIGNLLPATEELKLLETLTVACQEDASLCKGLSPEQGAEVLLNFATVCVLTRFLMPGSEPSQNMDTPAFLLGIAQILDK